MRYTDLTEDLVEVYPGGYTGDELADLEMLEDEIEAEGVDFFNFDD